MSTQTDKIKQKALRDEVLTLVNSVDRTYFTLGGKLAEVARDGLHDVWGFDSFEDYVEQELGFARRKAYYLISIYEKATELGIDPVQLESLGWTKAKEILLYVDSKKNFEKWAERAATFSVSALQEALKTAATGKAAPKKGKDEDGNKTVETPDGLFHIVEVALADDQYKNFKLALEKAAGVARSDKVGHLLDMIALDFLVHNAEISDIGEKLAEWANRGLIEIEDDGTGSSGLSEIKPE